MNRISRTSFVLLLGSLAGCGGGGGSSADPGPAPPHGGSMVAIPEGAGSVEVVKKPGAAEEEVSFYFYKSGVSPYSPAPTSGSLVLGEGKKVDLVAKGEALVTPPGPALFPNGDVEGLLTADLGGKPVSIRIGGR